MTALESLHRLVIGAALVSAAACARGDEPVEPVWGKEPCAHCSMIVGDKRYAAEVLTEAGSRHFFDDIGCMISFVDERHLRVKAWVRDESRGAWVAAETARYRRGVRTPMDYGFAFSAEGTLTLDDVRHEVLAKQRPNT